MIAWVHINDYINSDAMVVSAQRRLQAARNRARRLWWVHHYADVQIARTEGATDRDDLRFRAEVIELRSTWLAEATAFEKEATAE